MTELRTRISWNLFGASIVKANAKTTLNPLTASASHHVETSQSICREDQLTGFYMMGTIGR